MNNSFQIHDGKFKMFVKLRALANAYPFDLKKGCGAQCDPAAPVMNALFRPPRCRTLPGCPHYAEWGQHLNLQQTLVLDVCDFKTRGGRNSQKRRLKMALASGFLSGRSDCSPTVLKAGPDFPTSSVCP